MTVTFDRVKANAKAFLGALATAVGVALYNGVSTPDGGPIQLPHTSEEWGAFGAAVVLGFLLPWLKRNFPSVEKAEADLALAQKRVSTGKQSQ